MRFDYTKDGIRNRVQFWLEFKGRPAVGKPGDPDYGPKKEPSVTIFTTSIRNRKSANWFMGFSMMEGPPPSGPYPMTNLVIEGNTARFEAFGMKWTVVDGGEGYAKDRVTVDDGFRPREMKMYDGDLRVGPTGKRDLLSPSSRSSEEEIERRLQREPGLGASFHRFLIASPGIPAEAIPCQKMMLPDVPIRS